MDLDFDICDETGLDTRAKGGHVDHQSVTLLVAAGSHSPRDQRSDTSGHLYFGTHYPMLQSERREQKTSPISTEDITRAFLLSLYEYSDRKDIAGGSLLVIKRLDALMRKDDFRAVDMAMRNAYVSRLDPEIAFSFLTITAPARDRLDREVRGTFITQTRQRLLETRPPQYVDELLQRYK